MDVELYVYDLSNGMARLISKELIGTQIDALYHTSIVVGGNEYYYGHGIHICTPGRTRHGSPIEVLHMGETELPMDVVQDYLEALQETYSVEAYDVFDRNCNHFSNDMSKFLVGRAIPRRIRSLPRTVLSTPLGAYLRNSLSRRQADVASPSSSDSLESRDGQEQKQQDDLPMFLRPENLAPPPYAALPPLDKLLAKMKAATASSAAVKDIVGFLRHLDPAKPQDTSAPAPQSLSGMVSLLDAELSILDQPSQDLFPLLDLLRASAADPRVATALINVTPFVNSSLPSLIQAVEDAINTTTTTELPYNARLTTLRLIANLLSISTPARTRAKLVASSSPQLPNLINELLTADTATTAAASDATADDATFMTEDSRILHAAARIAWSLSSIFSTSPSSAFLHPSITHDMAVFGHTNNTTTPTTEEAPAHKQQQKEVEDGEDREDARLPLLAALLDRFTHLVPPSSTPTTDPTTISLHLQEARLDLARSIGILLSSPSPSSSSEKASDKLQERGHDGDDDDNTNNSTWSQEAEQLCEAMGLADLLATTPQRAEGNGTSSNDADEMSSRRSSKRMVKEDEGNIRQEIAQFVEWWSGKLGERA